MRIVIDVNVLLSGLIRDSTTRKIILQSELDFYFPEISLHKIRKYKTYTIKKSKLSEREYDILVVALLKRIQLVSTEEIVKNWEKAKQIMGQIDPEDVVFIATALSLENSVIWSDDKDFDKQNKIDILKTGHMIRFI